MNLYTAEKAFVMVSDSYLNSVITDQLEKCGYEVEGLLKELPHCTLIIVDHDALQLDIVNYLDENGIGKPVVLLLTEMQAHSTALQFERIFQDILTVRDRDMMQAGIVFSAAEGQTSLKEVFESYLPGHEKNKRDWFYARLREAA